MLSTPLICCSIGAATVSATVSAEVQLGEVQLGLGRRNPGASLGQSGGERPRIDRKQQLPLPDDRSVREVGRDDLSRDSRAHLDRSARFEAADIIVPQRHLALEGCRDRHEGSWWSSSGGGIAVPQGDGRG